MLREGISRGKKDFFVKSLHKMETTHRGMKSIRPPHPPVYEKSQKIFNLANDGFPYDVVTIQSNSCWDEYKYNKTKSATVALQRKELLSEVKGYDYGIGVIKSLPLVVCRRQH